MNSSDLKQRTKAFALSILKLIDTLPDTIKGRAIQGQLVRSGTSVGANYRAACRARSLAEFSAKLGVVIEEADESAFWCELIIADKLAIDNRVIPVLQEANELVAIMIQSRKTAMRSLKN